MREKRENKTKTQTNQYKQTNENKNNRTQQRSTYLNNPLCPLGLSPPPLSRGRCWRRQRHVRTGTPRPGPGTPRRGAPGPAGPPFTPSLVRGGESSARRRVALVRFAMDRKAGPQKQFNFPPRSDASSHRENAGGFRELDLGTGYKVVGGVWGGERREGGERPQQPPPRCVPAVPQVTVSRGSLFPPPFLLLKVQLF